MKSILLVLSILLAFTSLAQESTPATWIAGSNLVRSEATYGSKGISSSLNTPGSRFGSVTWTDASGNLWLFGGYGLDGDGYFSQMNDLWKFNVTTRQWIWVNGTNYGNDLGIYGIKGVASVSNIPRARHSAVSWKDNNGNFWLYGGTTYVEYEKDLVLSDLWKYNPNTNEWTWMGGTSAVNVAATYGALGIENANNYPGSRTDAVSWKDASGNFWLFGGKHLNGGTANVLNDLWKYNVATAQWTWVNGDNMANQPGNWGTKGVMAATNKPGARAGSVGWTDQSGNLWLFGGDENLGETTTGLRNDLWKYQPATNQWTWVSGDNTPDRKGSYGTKGVAAAPNKPGSREGAISWIDNNNNLCLATGSGYDGDGNHGDMNDFWQFNTTTNLWTWTRGSDFVNQPGVFGTKGVANSNNSPGSKSSASSWKDNAGNIYFFGGYGYDVTHMHGKLNDLWLLSGGLSALPVLFNNIDIKRQEATIVLSWSTASEHNSKSFIIQRSSGGDAFETIGQVVATNEAKGSRYQFTDLSPANGKNHYRIKQVDIDGNFSYSAIKSASFSAQSKLLWHAKQDKSIVFSLAGGNKEAYLLIDMAGKVIRKGNLENGSQKLSLLISGTYVLSVQIEKEALNKTILIP